MLGQVGVLATVDLTQAGAPVAAAALCVQDHRFSSMQGINYN